MEKLGRGYCFTKVHGKSMSSPCFSDKNMDLYCNLNEITLGCGTVKDKGVLNREGWL